MQPVKFLGRLSIVFVLISCVCSLQLAQTEDINARTIEVRAATKAKPKVVAAKAAPKAKAPVKAAPKAKAPIVAAPAKAPAKAVPKAPAKVPPPKAPAKAPPKTPATPPPTTAGTSCAVPKKAAKKARAFETEEERDAYYGIVKRDVNRDVKIRGRSIEKRTNVCGFHELRDQDQAEQGCQSNPARFVVDATTGNLVKQGQGRVAGVACDHIIELQLVADVMENTGACKSAELMLRAGGFQAGATPSLTQQMKDLIDKNILPTVNGANNVIFLDSGVNQSKKTYVQKFKGLPTTSLPNPTTANNGADAAKIKTYLKDSTIRGQSVRSAVNIDQQIAKFLDGAKKAALTELENRKKKAGAQCTETQQTKFAKDESVITAEPAFSKKANFPTMQVLWDKISAL